MKTLHNVHWLELSTYQRQRRSAGYTIAGILLALALWAAIGFVCAVLLT